ncbi:MAG: transcriptional regulator MarR family [Anaerolineaceae bacterium]|nr:MAG: transcriptional regulator MarR family [Anaerolineaceae bacterium]
MSPPKQFSDTIREWAEVFMHRSMRDFKRFMNDSGLSFTQVNLLMRLYHGGKIGVSELGGHLGITNAAASQAIDRLVKDGLIERSEDPQDRRAKRLTLTEEGHALIARGIETRGQWIAGLTEAFTPEQQAMIVSALTLLTEAARKTDE